jgi:hypothetical protein
VRLEGLDKLKKFNNLIGNQTHDLLACSRAPQLTTLPHALLIEVYDKKVLCSENAKSFKDVLLSRNMLTYGTNAMERILDACDESMNVI